MTLNTTRRHFLAQAILAAAAAASASAGVRRAPRVLLRSAWATINIGDIAHTPGMLRLLRTHVPEAEVFLWPGSLADGVDRLLLSEFPDLQILESDAELARAFDHCDFMIHGSKASVGVEDIQTWVGATGGKPYGIYGVTFPRRPSTWTRDFTAEELAAAVRAVSGAEFVFFRDSRSLGLARELGANAPVMEFGPDAAFACDLRDPVPAEAFLDAHGLETRKFLCCIPRLRFTPHWRIRAEARFDPVKDARNLEMQEHDHAPLRQAIMEVVRKTDLKVLVCPEDQTQMRVGKEMIVDRLPADVRSRVVWKREFWLTGEAISTYIRSAGLFGNEMHSPIMCVSHGIPAIVCRWAEQTTKGYMWEDIGLGEWLFDLDDEAQVERVAPTVLEMARNPGAAFVKAARARAVVERRQCETMAHVAAALPRV